LECMVEWKNLQGKVSLLNYISLALPVRIDDCPIIMPIILFRDDDMDNSCLI
jgi:hypothetical protein